MKVEVAHGDVVDRVSILEIKARTIADPAARHHVQVELDALRAAWQGEGLPDMTSLATWTRLAEVNQALWDVEDRLRAFERAGDFGPDFVADARAVYRWNDERAALKRAINLALGSGIVEEKWYPSAQPDSAAT